jgi:glutaredoxin
MWPAQRKMVGMTFKMRSRRALAVLLSIALMLSAALVLSAALAGCSEERDDGTTPSGDATLPELTLTDSTPELLLTWVDDRGRTHTGTSVAEVPEEGKELVRIITKDAGHGALFYVADLREKNADGSYVVRTMRRSEWETRISKRREAYVARHAPPPPPRASSTATGRTPPSSPPPTAAEGVRAVIYGASWCKPCHDAAKYLHKRGVPVVEHDIEKQPKYAAEMQRKLRGAGMSGGSIPVIDVGGVILRGFSRGAIDSAITRANKRGTAL